MMLSYVTHRPWRFSWISRRFDSGLAAVLLLSVSAGLTQQTRALRGRVKDEQGHVLVGAVVQPQSNAKFWIRSFITERDGQYHFEDYLQMSLIAYERLIGKTRPDQEADQI
jgi:hypothetical protein